MITPSQFDEILHTDVGMLAYDHVEDKFDYIAEMQLPVVPKSAEERKEDDKVPLH